METPPSPRVASADDNFAGSVDPQNEQEASMSENIVDVAIDVDGTGGTIFEKRIIRGSCKTRCGNQGSTSYSKDLDVTH